MAVYDTKLAMIRTSSGMANRFAYFSKMLGQRLSYKKQEDDNLIAISKVYGVSIRIAKLYKQIIPKPGLAGLRQSVGMQ